MIYSISYRTLIDSKPLHIKFNKTDGLIRVYDGIRYLVLFCPEKYDTIYNRIRYLISQKKVELNMFSLMTIQLIKVDPHHSLPLEKT